MLNEYPENPDFIPCYGGLARQPDSIGLGVCPGWLDAGHALNTALAHSPPAAPTTLTPEQAGGYLTPEFRHSFMDAFSQLQACWNVKELGHLCHQNNSSFQWMRSVYKYIEY